MSQPALFLNSDVSLCAAPPVCDPDRRVQKLRRRARSLSRRFQFPHPAGRLHLAPALTGRVAPRSSLSVIVLGEDLVVLETSEMYFQ